MIKLFYDGASIDRMVELVEKGTVQGITTNPSLMYKEGITDYIEFVKELTSRIKTVPISLEVFSDDFDIMEKEARYLSSFGDNIFVKIPITNTKGDYTKEVIKRLTDKGIKLNITAILKYEQAFEIIDYINSHTKTILSVFAGRIADTGRNPEDIIRMIYTATHSNIDILWASSRELYNIKQAEDCYCNIITVTDDILKKLPLMGKDLSKYSLETVKMFYEDAKNINFNIVF